MLTAIHCTDRSGDWLLLLYAFHGIINVTYATTTMEIQMQFHFTSGWKKSAFTKCDSMMMTMMIL